MGFPEVAAEAEAKTAGQLVRSPLIRVIWDGERAAKALADDESGLRVRARM